MRYNFTHNCIIHPICGIIWLIADVLGIIKCYSIKNSLVTFGEKIHSNN